MAKAPVGGLLPRMRPCAAAWRCTRAYSRIVGAALGVIIAIIIVHHIASINAHCAGDHATGTAGTAGMAGMSAIDAIGAIDGIGAIVAIIAVEACVAIPAPASSHDQASATRATSAATVIARS